MAGLRTGLLPCIKIEIATSAHGLLAMTTYIYFVFYVV